jgi:hypothetical protein
MLASYIDPETLFLGSEDGEFDSAIIGVGERDGHVVLVYDRDLIIGCLGKSGMTDEDAWDWYGFNIEGAFMGPRTPIYVSRLNMLDLDDEASEDAYERITADADAR